MPRPCAVQFQKQFGDGIAGPLVQVAGRRPVCQQHAGSSRMAAQWRRADSAAGKGGYPVILPVGSPTRSRACRASPSAFDRFIPAMSACMATFSSVETRAAGGGTRKTKAKLFVAEMGFFHGRHVRQALPSNNTLPAVGVSSAPSRWRGWICPIPTLRRWRGDSPARTVRSIFFRMVMRSAGPRRTSRRRKLVEHRGRGRVRCLFHHSNHQGFGGFKARSLPRRVRSWQGNTRSWRHADHDDINPIEQDGQVIHV